MVSETGLIKQKQLITVGRLDRSVYVIDRRVLENNKTIFVVVHGELLYHPLVREIVVYYFMEKDESTNKYYIRDFYEKIVLHNCTTKTIISENSFEEFLTVFNIHDVSKMPILTPSGDVEVPTSSHELFISKRYSGGELLSGSTLIYTISVRNDDICGNSNNTFAFFISTLFVNAPIPLLRRGIVVCDCNGDWSTRSISPLIFYTESVVKDIEAVVLSTRIFLRQNPTVKRVYFSFQPHEIYAMCLYKNGSSEAIRYPIGDLLETIHDMVCSLGMRFYNSSNHMGERVCGL